MGESVFYTGGMLEEGFVKAGASHRRRSPSPITADASPLQVLVNPVHTRSYLQPHKHPDHQELWSCPTGRLAFIEFYDDGRIENAYILGSGEHTDRLVHVVAPGVYHTALALTDRSSWVNVSLGPFDPDGFKVAASWAPPEATKEGVGRTAAEAYMENLLSQVSDILGV